MANNSYTVEYAKTDRSSCRNKKCEMKKIGKGSLRIGKVFPSSRFVEDGVATDWYHYGCAFQSLSRARKGTKKIDSLDDLEGFELLDEIDQKLILRCFKGRIPHDGGASHNSDHILDEKKSKKPKKKEKKKKKKKKEERADLFEEKDEDKAGFFFQQDDFFVYVSPPSVGDICFREGTYRFGRGSLMGFNDKRCSRDQIEMKVSATKKEASVARLGVNPSFLFRKDGSPLEMKRSELIPLQDGDSFCLLADMHQCRVEFRSSLKPPGDHGRSPEKKREGKSSPQTKSRILPAGMGKIHKKGAHVTPKKADTPKEKKKPTPKKPSAKTSGGSILTKSKKRKKKRTASEEESSGPDEYDYHDSFIDDSSVSLKKRKSAKRPRLASDSESDPSWDGAYSSGSDEEVLHEGREWVKRERDWERRRYGKIRGRRPCRYGSKCYRTGNPEHTSEFSHPGDKDFKGYDEFQSDDDDRSFDFESDSETPRLGEPEPPHLGELESLQKLVPSLDKEIVAAVYHEKGKDPDEALTCLLEMERK